MINCLECGKPTNNPKFCSKSCSASYGNRLRPKKQKQYKRNCLYCSTPTNNSKYCSKECWHKHRSFQVSLHPCLNCAKLISKNKIFCDNKCQSEHNYKQFIYRWKQGLEKGLRGKYGTSVYIRRYLFEKYDSKCCQCGWNKKNPVTGKSPLNIEHIDGDCLNNKEENLLLLCPNCHSLTPTYGSLNKNSSRKGRHKND